MADFRELTGDVRTLSDIRQGVPGNDPVRAECEDGGFVALKLDAERDTPGFKALKADSTEFGEFLREYNPRMASVTCVADKRMLLEYMVSVERTYGLTFSFPAYGVDTVVFHNMAAEQKNAIEDSVSVALHYDDDTSTELLYEKVVVDDTPYFSCLSECLDSDYLHRVIGEATEAIYMHNQYMYTLVGPRPLITDRDKFDASDEDANVEEQLEQAEQTTAEAETQEAETQEEQKDSTPTPLIGNASPTPVIVTLKLNTYELNVLVRYMTAIEGVTVHYGKYHGRDAILFQR